MAADLDSVTIVATDFAAALAFYDAAMLALGLQRSAEFGDEEEDDPPIEAAGWAGADGRTVLWLVEGSAPTSGAHLRLRVHSRSDVEQFFAAACAAGGSARTPPRRWAIYRRGDFVAAVSDPAGNTLEAVAPE